MLVVIDMRIRFTALLANSRFWILATGIVLSAVIAGFVQLYIPAGTLQTIRIEQYYGYASLILLYVALITSPLTKVFTHLPFAGQLTHARRGIGVLAFYYTMLHVLLTFFGQLDGFAGIRYLDAKYSISVSLGMLATLILLMLAATSFDWVIKVMHFKNWKLLHRLVYIAGVTIVIHILILGPSYASITPISVASAVALAWLVGLEAVRTYRALRARTQKSPA